jgi:hypothetical protein
VADELSSSGESPASVIAVFDQHEDASRAVALLKSEGFDIKKLSVIGKGYHTEEHPVGFYNLGERMAVWGGIGATWGALWGGFWGLLAGAAFLVIPGVGPIMAAGPFVAVIVGALEGSVVVGGLGALGAALSSIGVPKDRVVRYETALKADKYLLIVHGTADEVARGKRLLDGVNATQTEMYPV